MRSREEIKKGLEQGFYEYLKSAKGKIESEKNNAIRSGLIAAYKDTESYLENIDEVVDIAIGSATNNLISKINAAHAKESYEYDKNPKVFLTDKVVDEDKNGKRRFSSNAYGATECGILGIEPDELMIFFREPSAANDDEFRKSVNWRLGTNIPTSEELKEAQAAYDEAVESVEKAKALVTLKELKRNAGMLKNGGMYNILANDEEYQEAKAMCNSRTI